MKKYIYLVFLVLIINSQLFSMDAKAAAGLLESDDFTTWIAMFGLALIGFFALYLSSEKAEVLEKEYKKKEEEHNQIHQIENDIASKMGKSIYDIAQDKSSNTKLITMTTNLIDFLHIKSKKIEILNRELELSNLLNDVTGILKTNTKNDDFQLFYNINKDIAEKLISDTLNLSKILSNILIYSVENDSKNILLSIETNSFSTRNDQLLFRINTHLNIEVNIGDGLFDANYNSDTQAYESLSLFIAKELALLLDGDLVARNNDKSELEFLLSIPYKTPQNILSKEKQNEVVKTKKYIYVKDNSESSALHLQSILQDLNQDVVIDLKDETIINVNNVKDKDILFIDERFLTEQNIQILTPLNLQIIVYDDILKSSKNNAKMDINHIKISKPFTIWQIVDLLKDLQDEDLEKEKINSGNAIVYKNNFLPTKDIALGSFVQFKEKKILLVEDNVINQKVFCGMLEKSDAQIMVAENGQVALDILENDSDIDIIFMDINMPVMDGYTASIKIRENTKYDDIPIISLTTLTSSGEVAKMFASGINAYLAKPLKKEILFSVLAMFIKDTVAPTQIEIQTKETTVVELKGLDIELGISKSASNEVFYKEILMEFVDAYKDSTKIMQKYINDFRYEQLKIIALDIQGLSGTIGALDVHKEVKKIIKAIVLKEYDSIEKILIEYDQNLTTLMNSINKYLG